MIKKYTKKLGSVGCTFVDQSIASAGNFMVLIAAARCLKTEEFGLFSLGWAVALFFVGLQDSLITGPMRVMLPEYGENEDAYLARLDAIQCWMTLSALVLTIGVYLLLPRWSLTILGTGALVASRLQQAWIRQQFLAQLKATQAMWTSSVGGLPLILGCLILGLWKPDLDAVIIWAFAGFLPLLGWLILKPRRTQKTLPASTVIRAHREYGKWLLGSHLALWSSGQLYPFLIAGILGLKEVAILSACRSLLGVTHVFFQGLNAYCVPRLRRTRLTQPERFGKAWMTSATLGGVFVAPLLVCFMLFPGSILSTVLKGEYANQFAQSVFFWYSLVYFLVYAKQMLEIGIQALKMPQVVFASYLLSACFTLSCGSTMVRKYGIHGSIAAASVNCVLIIAGSLFYLFFQRKIRLVSVTNPNRSD